MIFKTLFLFLLFFTSILYSHQTGLSYVEIMEDEHKNISVVYKKPLEDTQAQDISIRYPSECIQRLNSIQTIVNGFVINRYKLWCGEYGLKDSRIWVDGLVTNDRGVLVRYEKDLKVQTALLRSTTPFIHINHKSSSAELLLEYINLGVVHIWGGFDHLLFVFALLLLALSKRALFYAITAFTLSHSITLAFGILGIVAVEILYVEAMIALSIIFLARELIVDDRDSYTRKNLGVVTFIFGLLHGFGFSSVLASIGLPQGEIPLSLFAFNLGIEIGQILFILFVGSILIVIKKYIAKYENKINIFIAYFIGSLSSYWLVERVISF